MRCGGDKGCTILRKPYDRDIEPVLPPLSPAAGALPARVHLLIVRNPFTFETSFLYPASGSRGQGVVS